MPSQIIMLRGVLFVIMTLVYTNIVIKINTTICRLQYAHVRNISSDTMSDTLLIELYLFDINSAVPSYNCALCLACFLRPPPTPLFCYLANFVEIKTNCAPLLQLRPVPRHRWHTPRYGTGYQIAVGSLQSHAN